MNKTVFITGSSGFIGSNLAKRILTTEPDTKVIGLDNMNDYYDVRIKEARLAELQKFGNYAFIKGNLADKALINSIFDQHHPDIVARSALSTLLSRTHIFGSNQSAATSTSFQVRCQPALIVRNSTGPARQRGT